MPIDYNKMFKLDMENVEAALNKMNKDMEEDAQKLLDKLNAEITEIERQLGISID